MRINSGLGLIKSKLQKRHTLTKNEKTNHHSMSLTEKDTVIPSSSSEKKCPSKKALPVEKLVCANSNYTAAKYEIENSTERKSILKRPSSKYETPLDYLHNHKPILSNEKTNYRSVFMTEKATVIPSSSSEKECPSKKALPVKKLVCANSNYKAAKYEMENSTERKSILRRPSSKYETPLDYLHNHKPILSNEKTNYRSVFMTEKETVIPSSSSEKECPSKKALPVTKLVCSNSNYTAAKYEIENSTERKSILRRPSNKYETPLDYHHNHKPILSNEKTNHHSVFMTEKETVIPSSSSEKECPLKKALRAAKLVCANSNYTAAKYESENSNERKSLLRRPSNKYETPLDYHHNHKSILSNKKTNHHSVFLTEKETVIPSSSSQKECPLKKALQAAKLVCANSNYTAAKYKVDEELKKRRREIFESARIEKEREQREEIEKNVNLQRQKDREEQEKIRAAKFVRANSNYTATKYKIDEELKKRRRETFENARIEKEREERERIANLQRKERAEREEKEKMENLQRLIRERKAHLALIEKVTQVEDIGENMKDYLELEKLCGYKPWFRYVPRNSKWEIFSSSNILNGTPLKKLGLFLKNEEEEEEKLYRQPIKKLRKA